MPLLTITRVSPARAKHMTRLLPRMSTVSTVSETKRHKFLVYAPDKTEEGTLAKRYEVRPQHLEQLQPHLDSGTVQLGGMLLSPEAIEENPARNAVGSLLIVQARTINEARKVIESDVYYTSGVWDSEKIIILPFVPATPFPL